MALKRWIIAGLLTVVAAPVAAQPPYYEIDSLRMQQEAAARSAVARTNELSTLEARLRTEQAIADVRRQAIAPQLPYLPYEPPASTGPAAATPKYPSVPDSMLADSNRRVREASRPPR